MSKMVSFIGGGDLGQALAGLLEDKLDVQIWDINPKRSSQENLTLSQAIADTEFIFITTPTVAVPTVISELSSKIHLGQKIILCSKGLTSSGQNVWEFTKVMLPHSQVAIVSGPMLSSELKDGKGGAGLVAGDAETAQLLSAIFTATGLELIETDADPGSLAWLGILKNIYALGLGYAMAKGVGGNQIGFLITLCVEEMGRWLEVVTDGDRSLASGLAGLGDLVTTGFSSDSKNSRTGRLVAAGHKELAVNPEGIHSLKRLVNRFGDLRQFPLANSLWSILQGQEIDDNPWVV